MAYWLHFSSNESGVLKCIHFFLLIVFSHGESNQQLSISLQGSGWSHKTARPLRSWGHRLVQGLSRSLPPVHSRHFLSVKTLNGQAGEWANEWIAFKAMGQIYTRSFDVSSSVLHHSRRPLIGKISRNWPSRVVAADLGFYVQHSWCSFSISTVDVKRLLIIWLNSDWLFGTDVMYLCDYSQFLMIYFDTFGCTHLRVRFYLSWNLCNY